MQKNLTLGARVTSTHIRNEIMSEVIHKNYFYKCLYVIS